MWRNLSNQKILNQNDKKSRSYYINLVRIQHFDLRDFSMSFDAIKELIFRRFSFPETFYFILQTFKQGWGAGKFFCGSGSWVFFQAAPAPDFFPKRFRLLFFFQAAPAPRSQKHPAPTGFGSWLLVKFGKIFFSPQTKKVKLQKNIKQVK